MALNDCSGIETYIVLTHAGVYERGDAVPRLDRRRRSTDTGQWRRSSCLSCRSVPGLDAEAGHSLYHAEISRPHHSRRARRGHRQMSGRLWRRLTLENIGRHRVIKLKEQWGVYTIQQTSIKLPAH